MPIRMLIYEDEVLLRDANERELVGTFGDCLRVNDQTYRLQPDVILMDIDLPGRDSIQAVTSLHREFPAVLMLPIFDDDNPRRTRNAPRPDLTPATTADPDKYYREFIIEDNPILPRLCVANGFTQR